MKNRKNKTQVDTNTNLIHHPHVGTITCNVPEFEPSTYQGLKKNCGRKSKHVDAQAIVNKVTTALSA